MAPLVSHFWSSAPGAAGSNAEAKEEKKKGQSPFEALVSFIPTSPFF